MTLSLKTFILATTLGVAVAARASTEIIYEEDFVSASNTSVATFGWTAYENDGTDLTTSTADPLLAFASGLAFIGSGPANVAGEQYALISAAPAINPLDYGNDLTISFTRNATDDGNNDAASMGWRVLVTVDSKIYASNFFSRHHSATAITTDLRISDPVWREWSGETDLSDGFDVGGISGSTGNLPAGEISHIGILAIDGTTNNDRMRLRDFSIQDVFVEPPPVGPNVIVFLVDDLGLTDVQQHPTYFPDGSPLFETPNMHRLASEGMRFRNVYAQPLCSASRACLLSGQHTSARDTLYLAIVNNSVSNPSLPASSDSSRPYNHPTDRNHLPLAVETIAERMKAAGYATWHAGKWHLSPASANTAYYPDKQGFDKQLGVGGSGPPSYFGPFNNIPNMVNHLGEPDVGTKRDHISEHMGRLARNLIDHHLATDPARPFFLYYPTYSVHAPHQCRKSLCNYYQAKLAGLPESKHRHPVMAAQVEMADRELGDLLDFLDDRNLDENTLFIFLSDNGGLSNEQSSGELFDDIGADGIPDHLPGNTIDGNYAKSTAPIPSDTRMSEMAPRKAGKGSLFDGGLRVPMIVRYPDGGIPAGANCDLPVHLTDLYPTILGYTPATAKPDYPLDGTSLQPVLDQTGQLPERDLYIYFPRSSETWGHWFIGAGYPGTENEPFDTYPGGTAVIHYPFKMIARYSTAHDAATVDYQLFRLDADEGETTNVAGLYPEVVDAMRQRMDAFHQETNALVPTKNPNYDGTSRDLPETTAQAYFADAGLAPNTPQTFLLTDPDGDSRRNEDEFLQQTKPSIADAPVATTWLYDNGSFLETRFGLPANVVQSSFEILDADGNVAFTPSSGLTLDGQYGPFYVYRPTNPQPGANPADLSPSVVRPVPGPSTPPAIDPADFPRLSIGSGAGSIHFNLKDQIGHRLYKSTNLTEWKLWEDFGVVFGNHDVTVPLNPAREREFYKLEVYQP